MEFMANPFDFGAGGGGGSVTVGLPATQQDASAVAGGNAGARSAWRFNPDGTVDKRTGGTYAYDHDWCDPTGGAPGNDYDIYVTYDGAYTGEGVDPGNTSTFLNLSVAREWLLGDTTSGAVGTGISCSLTVYILETGETNLGNALDSQTYTILSWKT